MKKEILAIATKESFPTHRLKIVKGREGFKEIIEYRYFTADQAAKMCAVINNFKEPFLVLGTEFFEKKNISLEEMTPSEIRDMNEDYFKKIRQSKENEKEAREREKDAEIDEWIKQNKKSFEHIIAKVKEDSSELETPFFWNLSEKARNGIYKSKARMFVREEYFPEHNA